MSNHNDTPGRGRQHQHFDTIASAAPKLGLTEQALRARCRRSARREGDRTTAHLGGGITAFLLGRTWRVRFPEP